VGECVANRCGHNTIGQKSARLSRRMCESLRRQPDNKKEGYMGRGTAPGGIVVPARQQHALRHASLNLTLQRFTIASEAAGGIFTGQLLTNARLDVLTLA
jgi:hypothetical protein